MGLAYVVFPNDNSLKDYTYFAHNIIIKSHSIVIINSYEVAPGKYEHYMTFYQDKVQKTILYSSNSSEEYPGSSYLIPMGLPMQFNYNGAASSTHAMAPLFQANKILYGSHVGYAGGCHYGIREASGLYVYRDGGWKWAVTLHAGYRVIIGNWQGSQRVNGNIDYTNCEYLRAWGYIRDDGTVVETNNLYVKVNVITDTPLNYSINTR